MVPGVGVEPTRLASVDFESTASANSATRALEGKEIGAPVGSRTPNLLIRSQMLYPIELRVHFFKGSYNANDMSKISLF